ncbi:WD repeat and HMG-box DNA-binding protein 1 [Blattella germanica]|nr:WD repeat and HMG-box DNA-binding protein 1 [Blattella germanica]
MTVKKRPMRYAHADGHTNVCYSEDGKHILTCGVDGDVRIWLGLEDDDPSSQCVAEQALTVVHKGDHYYVGSDNNNVQAYTFPGSDRDGIVSRFTAPVTHIDISDDGKKLVAGSRFSAQASSSCDGSVRVWTIEEKQAVMSWNCVPTCNDFFAAKCLGRPSWQPKTGRFLAVPHGKEIRVFQRTVWDKMFAFTHEEVKHDFSIATFSPCGEYLAGCTIGGDICVWNVNLQTSVGHVQHDRGYAICGMAWNPSGNGEMAFCDIMGQLGTVVGCVSSLHEKSMTVDEMIQLNPLDDEDDEDNENAISLEKIKAELSQPNLEDLDKLSNEDAEDDVESRMSLVTKVVPSCDLQSPFQPSATPVHLQHRFMVWNSVGIVRCYNTEDENSIDVEFHDTALHHAMHMNNFLKHTMAALTEEVLVLACEAQDEAPSKMVCVLLNSWDGSKEWNVDLPEGEEALAVAAGQGWVAVATDTRSLRLFTVAGTQREAASLPGPVVCLAGHKNRLLAVYHDGMGLPGDQRLSFAIFSVGLGQLQALTTFQPVAMTPKSTLKWAGFSDEGTPFTFDSSGMLRLFSRKGYWMPVCDTQSQCKGKSDHYFVIGISEKYQNVRCVLCKGAHYPPTTPRPAVAEIPLQLPLCEAATEKSLLEEKFWRSLVARSTFEDLCKTDAEFYTEKDIADRTLKETAIKMFALACRSDLENRAVELCNLMPSHQVVQLAMKYASKLGKMHLTDKVAEVVTRKLEESSSGFEDSYGVRSTWEHAETPPLYSRNNSQEEDDNDKEDVSSRKNGHPEDRESLLLVAKQRQSESKMEMRPTLSLSQKRLNPFKKAAVKVEGSALENLSASYAQLQQSKNKATHSGGSFGYHIRLHLVILRSGGALFAKQSKLPTSKSPDANGKVPSFFQWFEKEKSNLKEEFPDLAATELSRRGILRYKELVKANKLVRKCIDKSSRKETSQKRHTYIYKLCSQVPLATSQDDSRPDGETQVSEDSTNSSRLSETMAPESKTPVQEVKKRKLDVADSEQPAKKTSSSKLMAFMFKKS